MVAGHRGRGPGARRRRPGPRRGAGATTRTRLPVGRHRGADEADPRRRVGRPLEPLDRRRRTCHMPGPRYLDRNEVLPSIGVSAVRTPHARALGSHRTLGWGRGRKLGAPSPSATDDDAPAHRYTAALAREIELRWQEHWDADGTFEAPNPAGPLADPDGVAARGRKLFVLDMFPYPSGTGLHVGHPLGFTGTDVYSRYQRMAGRNVLYTMGFDAFGLPAEQFAVQTGTHPAITTAENVATYREQIRRLGLSHDRRRSIDTTDPAYYRWTQWIFLQIFESWYDPDATNPSGSMGCARPISRAARRARRRHPRRSTTAASGRGCRRPSRPTSSTTHRLAYVSDAPVNWCPGLGTVVANEEVTADGRSDRGNFPVFKRNMRQWMMRITAYADRLIDDLDVLEWTDSLKTMQRNWIGRSHGRQRRLRLAGRADHRVHDAPRHAVRRHVHGARPRAPAGRRPDDVGGGAGGARLPPPGRDAQGRRPPGREPPEDRRVHRQLRHQPGHRPGHPDLDRRLRADGLRHRGDHGRAVRRPARLRVRPRASAWTSRRSSSRPTSGSPRTASRRRSTRRAGRRRSSATPRTSTRPTATST